MQPQPPQPHAPVIIKLLQGVIYSDDPHWDRLQSYLAQVKDYFSKIGLRVQNYETDGFAYLEQPDADPEERVEVLPRLTVRRSLTKINADELERLKQKLENYANSPAPRSE